MLHPVIEMSSHDGHTLKNQKKSQGRMTPLPVSSGEGTGVVIGTMKAPAAPDDEDDSGGFDVIGFGVLVGWSPTGVMVVDSPLGSMVSIRVVAPVGIVIAPLASEYTVAPTELVVSIIRVEGSIVVT